MILYGERGKKKGCGILVLLVLVMLGAGLAVTGARPVQADAINQITCRNKPATTAHGRYSSGLWQNGRRDFHTEMVVRWRYCVVPGPVRNYGYVTTVRYNVWVLSGRSAKCVKSQFLGGFIRTQFRARFWANDGRNYSPKMVRVTCRKTTVWTVLRSYSKWPGRIKFYSTTRPRFRAGTTAVNGGVWADTEDSTEVKFLRLRWKN